MLYINWVYKGSVVVSKAVKLESSKKAADILQTNVEYSWKYNTDRLYITYGKPENCDRFFISTNTILDKWVG